jgi:hypothetical protein
MAWDERVPCAFKLLLPQTVPQPQKEDGSGSEAGNGQGAGAQIPSANYVSRIGSLLPRFRAAGVRAFVDTAQDAWILGSSVLRSADASEGEGVTVHATRLRDQRADLLVSLDHTS